MPPEASAARAILSIAGSDPSGGAGLQADLKTFTALGVYGAAAVTCITVQNSQGVRYFEPLAPRLVSDQIQAVLTDLPVSHVKIGMLGSQAVAEAVAGALAEFSGEIIYDPVMLAGSGHSLYQNPGGDREPSLLPGELLDRVTVLTPNLPELAVLCGRQAAELEAAVAADYRTSLTGAAAELFRRHPRLRAVVVTGAHHQPQSAMIQDVLCRRQGEKKLLEFSHPRLPSRNLHGTGCTFASALAAGHLLWGSYEQALPRAIAFLERVIDAGSRLDLGRGNGPLGHHLYNRQ